MQLCHFRIASNNCYFFLININLADLAASSSSKTECAFPTAHLNNSLNFSTQRRKHFNCCVLLRPCSKIIFQSTEAAFSRRFNNYVLFCLFVAELLYLILNSTHAFKLNKFNFLGHSLLPFAKRFLIGQWMHLQNTLRL